ncbi:MAG: molybdenum cofactor guanylyltransferase [bacterium]|nr:molybdenum cofactor guanylyltransferase [bacterium]
MAGPILDAVYPLGDRPAPAPARTAVTGLLLCGGASSRMGRDKATLEFAGTSLLERALATLDGLCGKTVLACGATPRYAELERPLVLDEIEAGGPLAGLAAGLAAARTEWTLALACDMPAVDGAFLSRLLGVAASSDADVTIYQGERGPEPTCAVYRHTCLDPVRSALARGERRMVAFWTEPSGDGARPLRVTPVALERCRTDEEGLTRGDPLLNVNTPADLGRAREQLARGDDRSQ